MTTTSNELSTIVSGIEPSLTMSITALAGRLRSEGQNVIGFGAGEPDFDTPDPIKQAAIAAIESKTSFNGTSMKCNTPSDGENSGAAIAIYKSNNVTVTVSNDAVWSII